VIARAIGGRLDLVLAVNQSASLPTVWSTQAEFELGQRINKLPNYAPAGFGASQPASWPTLWTGAISAGPSSWPTVLSTENEADARRRVTSNPYYRPPMYLGAGTQPASWPRNWSTESEFDLQSRLSRLPFYASPIQAMRVAPAGLGADSITDIFAKASQILTKAGPYLDTVLQIVQDPALPQVIDRVKLIRTLSAGPSPATPAPSTAPAAGFELKRTLPVLDAVIWYEKHRWAPYVAGAGVILVLGGIGFGIGRATKKKCKTGAVGRRYRRKR
jgi:hypothetical protein